MAHSFDSNGHHALVVPAHNVKTVKTFLEEHQILDKSRKITPYTPESIQDDPSVRDQRFNSGKWFIIPFLSRAPSTIPTNGSGAATIEAHFGDLTSALESRLTPDALSNISIVHISTPGSGQTPTTQPNNPLRAAFHSALSSTLPAETLSALSLTTAQLVADLPGTYSIYPPLLLLPAHTFHRPSWTTFLSAHHHHHQPLDTDPTTFQHLLAHVAQHLSVTHIALNAPIALHNAGASSDQNDNNILRSPTALTPLLGSFGPRLSPATHAIPDASDFAAAFWATARQNGVAQTWAPLHTMFSRGNVKEKARVLGLASVAEAVRVGEEGSGGGRVDGRKRAKGCTAVDLYAGIGYFAFSYRKAGVRAVLGWEINPWSVEGLRRGAGMNGWGVRVVVGGGGGEEEVMEEDGQEGWESDFVVFRESNVCAAERVERLRGRLPPVRHVNGGLLPTSRGAWETAVRILDPEMGGWVHLHENFGESEVAEKADEVVAEVRRIWGVVKAERCDGDGVVLGENALVKDVVKLEHVERVKTYAPGVLHCVLDIWISPTGNMART